MTLPRRPPEWPERERQARFAEALRNPAGFAPQRAEREAFAVVKEIPDGLRVILIAELERGNVLVSLDQADWPHQGSIFIALRDRFHPSTRILSPEVQWRSVEDPHYWREEISQSIAGVQHLIVC